MFKSLNHFELNFLIWCKFPISFFTCGYTVFLTPFVEETLLSLLYIPGTLLEDQLTIHVWIYFQAFILFHLVYMPLFMAVPHTKKLSVGEYMEKLEHLYTVSWNAK